MRLVPEGHRQLANWTKLFESVCNAVLSYALILSVGNGFPDRHFPT